jgi:hypothetical protein
LQAFRPREATEDDQLLLRFVSELGVLWSVGDNTRTVVGNKSRLFSMRLPNSGGTGRVKVVTLLEIKGGEMVLERGTGIYSTYRWEDVMAMWMHGDFIWCNMHVRDPFSAPGGA